jgi:hypothetical protein
MSILTTYNPTEGIRVITVSELKSEIINKDKIPMCQLHPLTQYVLRQYAEKTSMCQKWFNDDTAWKKNDMSVARMFGDAYRVEEKNFNPILIRGWLGFAAGQLIK